MCFGRRVFGKRGACYPYGDDPHQLSTCMNVMLNTESTTHTALYYRSGKLNFLCGQPLDRAPYVWSFTAGWNAYIARTI